MKFHAAIFDLDGTLLDTLDDLADSMNEALVAMGFPAHEVNAYRYFVGDGVHALVERTLPEGYRDASTIQRTLEIYRHAYGRNWHRKSKPYPGIPEAIAALHQAGIPMAVLSNKPQHFTNLCMEQFFPDGPFSPILGQRDGIPHKPDPAAALEISEILGISPAEVAFVGDTQTDMLTGSAAGMGCLGVAWGFRPSKELTQSGAHTIIQRPENLQAFFLT